MTQYAIGAIDPATTDGTDLADKLNAWIAAVETGHRGAARPSYAAAGMTWPKSVSASLTELYYYDGTQDHLILSVNPSTGLVVDANAYLRDAANLNAGKLHADRLTAADLLALMLTVDGAASGLDAQLLAGTSLASVLARANHTGTQPLSSVVGADDASNLTAGKLHADRLTAADLLTLIKTVDGAASGLDAQLLAGTALATILGRANHTGVQALATISDAGDAAGKNVGLLAGNVVEVQAGAELPAVGGSNLTGLPDFSANIFASPAGYSKLPNGLIFQWSKVSAATWTFPIAFPSACIFVSCTADRTGSTNSGADYANTVGVTSAKFLPGSWPAWVFAIGY